MTKEQFREVWADVNQTEVANLLGVTQGTISKYWNGTLPIPGPIAKLTQSYDRDRAKSAV